MYAKTLLEGRAFFTSLSPFVPFYLVFSLLLPHLASDDTQLSLCYVNKRTLRHDLASFEPLAYHLFGFLAARANRIDEAAIKEELPAMEIDDIMTISEP